MSARRRGPTFLYIGTPKAGSTWLAEALRTHPEVYIPPAKDLQFFDRYYAHGMNWYLRRFAKAGNAVAIGELSHDYYASPEAALRIRAHLPEVRLVCCLREPGAFAVSTLRWWLAHTRRFGRTLEEMAASEMFARQIAYRASLEAYYGLFPRERILVVFYEDLLDDPRAFLEAVYGHIGVDPGFAPAVLGERRNPTRAPRSGPVLRLLADGAQVLRALGAADLVGAVKTNPLFDRLVYGGAGQRSDAETEAALLRIAAQVRRAAASEHDALAELIDRPLPAVWRAAAQAAA